MTDADLLTRIKNGLGITGDFQDDTLSVYLTEVKAFMASAGVPANIINSEVSVGCIMRGVADLWNYGSGNAKLSDYFKMRVIQLKEAASPDPQIVQADWEQTDTAADDYIKNKPTINNVELIGNKTSADLGLVSAEEGKGLSTNDYTHAEKAKLSDIEEGATKYIQIADTNGSLIYTGDELKALASQKKFLMYKDMPVVAMSTEGTYFTFAVLTNTGLATDFAKSVTVYRVNALNTSMTVKGTYYLMTSQDPKPYPDPPAESGVYVLSADVDAGGRITYFWSLNA